MPTLKKIQMNKISKMYAGLEQCCVDKLEDANLGKKKKSLSLGRFGWADKVCSDMRISGKWIV